MPQSATLVPGSIIRGPTLPEPIEVLALVALGDSVKVIGRGLQSGRTHDPVLTPAQLANLAISSGDVALDGDPRLFRLGVEAHRLGLAYEYDPFFSLSIARVDPLPHQVSFEVTVEPDQAQMKTDETRTGLKELGLDESVGQT